MQLLVALQALLLIFSFWCVAACVAGTGTAGVCREVRVAADNLLSISNNLSTKRQPSTSEISSFA
jgi:hypothetical protein